jgi:carboxypeptidase A4
MVSLLIRCPVRFCAPHSTIMKFLGVALASLGLASAASVTKKVSYDDWKVYRVNVGSNAAKVNDVVNKLQLQLWKGKPSESSVVDVLVPPTQVKDFEASTDDIETRVMHENLGLSIADEETVSVYAGTYLPQISEDWQHALTGNISRARPK